MIQNVVLGILCILLIALAFMFNKEKNASKERAELLEKQLSEEVKKHRKELAEVQLGLQKSLSASAEDIRKALEKNAEAAREASSKNTRKILSVEEEMNKQAEYLSRNMNDVINASKDEADSKIAVLAEAMQQLMAENAELRKKLQFFAEIEEDSKNINETEDTEAREALIQQALREITAPRTEKKEQIEKLTVEKEPAVPDETGDELEEERREESELLDTEAEQASEGILDEEQSAAFRIMNNTHDNLFITGKAGTGKSFLLDMFVRAASKEILVLAPTGIAALNVKGATIHSAFGYNNLENLDLDEISRGTIRLKREKREVLENVETIVIDEISMVRADTFEKIEKILRIVNDSTELFGGKQMILFGDLFQLPPIARWQEEKFLLENYGGIFFFNSSAYVSGDFNFIELTTNHRQKEDEAFFGILNRMREGQITSADISKLNDRYVSDRSQLRRVMSLFPRKADAEFVNKRELESIEAKEYVYKSTVLLNTSRNNNPNIDANFPISDELHLRRGALVMMVANDNVSKRWVNGTVGVVHTLTEDGISVTIEGETYEIPKFNFTQREAVYENGRLYYRDVLIVEQYPIILAYAITIHKSQGMTYKRIACDISKCFAPGQAYVALSRCSSMNGLYLIKRIDKEMINIDQTVVEFYLSQSTEETLEKYS